MRIPRFQINSAYPVESENLIDVRQTRSGPAGSASGTRDLVPLRASDTLRSCLSLANTWAPISPVDFLIKSTTGSRMLTALMVLLRSLRLICGGHRAVVLENLALRQQLAVLTRTVTRPQLRATDRLFWIFLAKGWRDWRAALVVVRPDTVVRWHRQWLRGIGPGSHDGGIQAVRPRVQPFAPSSAQ
jgi:hypothetical protein